MYLFLYHINKKDFTKYFCKINVQEIFRFMVRYRGRFFNFPQNF